MNYDIKVYDKLAIGNCNYKECETIRGLDWATVEQLRLMFKRLNIRIMVKEIN